MVFMALAVRAQFLRQPANHGVGHARGQRRRHRGGLLVDAGRAGGNQRHQAQQSHAATHSRPSRGGSYAFEVHRDATKPQIREAIEKIYNVKVMSVRTANRKGKARRVKFKTGITAEWKKAVVVLQSDYHIYLF